MTTSVSSQKWERTLTLVGVIHFMLWTLNRISNRWIDRRWPIGRRLRSRLQLFMAKCASGPMQSKTKVWEMYRPAPLIWPFDSIFLSSVCPRLRFEISSYKVWPSITAHLEDMTDIPLNESNLKHTPLYRG